ncbi:MAG TPA: hypothetical protein VNA69_08475 [Thermoanaerobaculia bacterium]|nr:hypothetical protein [Thermoanaerobaculia bacterium]
MKRALVLTILFALAATAAGQGGRTSRPPLAGGMEIVRAGPWDLHSSFWMSLHQTLMHDATRPDPRDVYRMPFPERVRVYIAPHAGPFGAYTITNLRNAGITTTMSSRDAGYQGFRALDDDAARKLARAGRPEPRHRRRRD